MNIRDHRILFEYLENFPAQLDNAIEIADYIVEYSTEDKDHQMIEEYFFGTYAVLEKVNLENLKEGDEDHNIRDEDKENYYKSLNPETMPPIVIENNEVVDGNHRVRVAKEKDLESIYAYVVYEK